MIHGLPTTAVAATAKLVAREMVVTGRYTSVDTGAFMGYRIGIFVCVLDEVEKIR